MRIFANLQHDTADTCMNSVQSYSRMNGVKFLRHSIRVSACARNLMVREFVRLSIVVIGRKSICREVLKHIFTNNACE